MSTIHSYDTVVIEVPYLKDKVVVLKLQEFDPEIDVDEILRIDYGNIMGEVLTFPLIFNRISNLKSEMQSVVAESKLDLDIFEAQLSEEYRKKIEATERATDEKVKTAIRRDVRWRNKMSLHITKLKQLDMLDGLYWSAKSKDGKLDKLTEKFSPNDMEKELIEGVVNGVLIKFSKKAIQ